MSVTVPEIPGLPRDGEGPVFEAPWQAQAFAMAVRLNERGLFSWPEWATRFGEERANRLRRQYWDGWWRWESRTGSAWGS